MIYIVILLICLILVFVEQMEGSQRIMPYLEYGFIFFLVLVMGTRYFTGPDYGSYMDIYRFPGEEKIEPLFLSLIYPFRKLGMGYNVFLLFIAALSLGFKMWSMKKCAPYFFLSLLIALPVSFMSDMGQIRFSLSMSVLWLTIPYCLERKLTGYLILMLIAFLLHYTAIVFLPIYWLCRLRLSLWQSLGVWVVFYAFSLLYMNTALASQMINLVTENDALFKYQVYGEDADYLQRYHISIFAFISKILALVVIYYASIPDEKIKYFFYNVIFLGGCFFFFFSFNEILAGRLSLYFFSFEALAIPMVILYTKDVKYHYFLIGLFVVKSIYQYTTLIFGEDAYIYLPYRSFIFSN